MRLVHTIHQTMVLYASRLSWKVYFPVIIFIFTWWFLGLKPAKQQISSGTPAEYIVSKPLQLVEPPTLSNWNRSTLQQALSGNFSLINKLITEWDIDAQMLRASGHVEVKMLSRDNFLRSQRLARQIQTKAQEKDNTQPQRYIPQTYVAASFLYALVDAKQIVALPSGLREQKELFPKQWTNQIKLDIDRHHSEKIFLSNPQIAFVSPYTHPATMEALREQQVKLCSIKSPDCIADIIEGLIEIGHRVEKNNEAELLALFMESAMYAIDNRLAFIKQSWTNETPQILMLHYHNQFTTPTVRGITGQLLERLGLEVPLCGSTLEPQGWTRLIENEQIINLNPDCLIVATTKPSWVKKEIDSNPIFNDLCAKQQESIFFVDDTIQQFPSQYIVLAYYDIFHALAMAKF